MNRLSTRLGALALLAAVLTGCAGLEFEELPPEDPYDTTGERMKSGPGLFSGKDGKFTIFSY